MSDWEVEVWDANYDREVIVTPQDPGASLTLCHDGQEVGVTLNAFGVRKLRLALQRIERELKERGQ